MSDEYIKRLILNAAQDLARDLIFYDRKEDEELRPGTVEAAVRSGVVSVDEIVEVFKIKLVGEIE